MWNLVFAVATIGLILGVVGLLAVKAGGTGILPKIGATFACIGLGLWIIGALYLVPNPTADQLLTPIGGLIHTIGMLLMSISIIQAKVFQGWQRFATLPLGIWFFLQLPLQFMFFMGADDTPSYALLLGVWGVLWALAGYAIWSQAKQVPSETISYVLPA